MTLEQIKTINKHMMNSTFSLCEAYGKDLPPVEAIVDLTDATMNYIEDHFPGAIGDYGHMYLAVGNTIANYMMMYRRNKVWGK